MTENDKRNRRIAKNTLMLYLRMLMTMGISLYTSRIILAHLGVEDFGIYNIVAGIVVFFSFLNSAMTHTSQRYLSVAIAKNDKNLIQETFSTSIVSHLIISAILLVLAETIGLWFVNNQLTIPNGRLTAANIVYQFAIAITIIEINKIPYYSSIVANEKMTFFAYLAIVESLMKLAVAISLTFFNCDLLIIYGALLLVTAIIVITAFITYCNKNFKNCKFIPKSSKPMLKEFLSFSGWNLIGSSAYLGYTQGVNILLNIFRGVALNATIGIANQIRSATYSFVYYFQTASNPQIIKAYTNKEHDRFTSLVCNISKYSFFMMLAIAIPIVLNIEYILNLWLVNPPIYCSIFSSMMVIICLFDALEGPLWVAVQASGNIRNYQIATGIIFLLNIPVAFIALKYGTEAYSVMFIQLALVIIAWLTRIYFAKKCSSLKFATYFKKVIVPIATISNTYMSFLCYKPQRNDKSYCLNRHLPYNYVFNNLYHRHKQRRKSRTEEIHKGKNQQMRLTIIIPMYKTEKYISDCLNSILNQDKGNIDYDIVAVNDGSPDKTAEIAERILSKSSIKYTIINQQNQGLSCARNAGLKIAHGDFIWFIDSDDTIAEHSFRTLSKIEADNIDAIAINGLEKIEETLKPCVQYGKFSENAVDGHTFFQSSIWSVCPPLTLYRKEFLKANNLEFHPHIYHEDNEFTTRAYFFAERIYVTSVSLYNIRETPQSITRSVIPKRSFDLITVASLLDEFKNQNATDKQDIKVFKKMISVCLNSALEDNLKYSESDRCKLSEALFANRRLFKNMLNYPSLKYKIEAGLFLLFPKQIVTIYNILNKLLRR